MLFYFFLFAGFKWVVC